MLLFLRKKRSTSCFAAQIGYRAKFFIKFIFRTYGIPGTEMLDRLHRIPLMTSTLASWTTSKLQVRIFIFITFFINIFKFFYFFFLILRFKFKVELRYLIRIFKKSLTLIPHSFKKKKHRNKEF